MDISDVSKIKWKRRENSGLIDHWYSVQACLESEQENSLELNLQSFYDSNQSSDDLGQLPEEEFVNLSNELLFETVSKVKKNAHAVEEIIKKIKHAKKLTF